MKKKIWVVVANSSLSKIYVSENPNTLSEIKTFEHPESRLHGHELRSDQEGKNNWGCIVHVYEEKMPPKLKEADSFAKELSHFLEEACKKEDCHALYIVASPPFLGILRGTLGSFTSKALKGEIPKDLTHSTPQQIRDHLPPVL